MDVKARIGLWVALIATAIALILSVGMVAAQSRLIDPAPDSSIKKCQDANNAVNEIVVVKEMDVPGSCPPDSQLRNDATLNNLCKDAQESWISQAKNACRTASGVKPCTTNAAIANILIRGGIADTRKCEVLDPGHVVRFTCTTKETPICSHTRDCMNDCVLIRKTCLSTCPKNDKICEDKCFDTFFSCLTTCVDP